MTQAVRTATLSLQYVGKNTDVAERYEALVIAFSVWLFRNNVGYWDGRETGITPKKLIDKTNFWFIRAAAADAATKELNRLKEVFRVTETQIRFTSHTKPIADLTETSLAKQKEFTWIWNR